LFARADAPVHARQQGVLFYLYARDLFALRESLVADGVGAGEIVDGTPARAPRCASKIPTATC
jgi:hypothetical protein